MVVRASKLRAMRSDGPTAAAKAGQWRRVLRGMFDGSLRHGLRTPVADTPAWVTLEVAHGGFATGRYAASGPLQAHEAEKLASVGQPASATLRCGLTRSLALVQLTTCAVSAALSRFVPS